MEKRKAYMLDEEVEVNIEIPKDEAEQEVQTLKVEYEEGFTNTEAIVTINRGYQFPEE